MTNEQIKEMLYDIMETYNGFDGSIKGLLLINEYIQILERGDE